ncbi:MAG: single-stranded-DNA-specific exonuclease [Granulosicoccus sp.]
MEVHVRKLPGLQSALHENSLVHRILAARGILDTKELDLVLGDLPRPDLLPNIDLAVSRLLSARNRSEKVLIVGDYDCDGATSTTVAMLGLAMLGFENLDYLIPNRFVHGYGLSPAIVDQAKQHHNPDIIITVDNGVASIDGVDHASKLGIDVVVTDHHLPPEMLPNAVAIVNPNLNESTFPAVNLAGVGVIFYTLIALRSELARQSDPAANAPIADLLDLVAIGTVADVVPLDATNRILVEQGLRRIRRGKTRHGVLSLLSAAGCNADTMSTQDIGFGIGPRLNAAGRLDDMRLGVECLMSRSKADADSLSQTLNSLNEQRRAIERDMRSTADEQLAALSLEDLDQADNFSICLHDDEWHQGVIGILAGRIKESLHRPVIIFTSDNDEEIKGSARSIPGVHIRDVLQSIATEHVGMIDKFGGHAMAAGLTLGRQYLDEFRKAFENAVRNAVNSQLRVREFHTDGSLPIEQRTLSNAAVLATIMPWGQDFEAPMFSDYFAVADHRVVGTGHLKLTLNSWGDTDLRPVDAIAFNCDLAPRADQPVFAIYSLDVNTWRDRQSLQLRVHHLEQAALR